MLFFFGRTLCKKKKKLRNAYSRNVNMNSLWIHSVETEVLPRNQQRRGTRQYPVLSKVLERMNGNLWSHCSMAESHFNEMRLQLTIEKNIICNKDIVVSPQTLRKDILKGVHDYIHWDIMCKPRRSQALARIFKRSRLYKNVVQNMLKENI